MQSVLVIGASGFLGWNFCSRNAGRFRITGTGFVHSPRMEGIAAEHLDLRRSGEVDALLSRLEPDAVLHLAAVSMPNECQKHPGESRSLNVDAAVEVARWCASAGTRFVFTSTDLVFDGENAPYGENAVPAPVSEYGRQKAEAEARILDVCSGATVCRMPLMFGDPGPHARTFMQEWLEAMGEGRPLSLFTDEFRTPVSGGVASEGLALVIDRGLTGILHLGGGREPVAARFRAAIGGSVRL